MIALRTKVVSLLLATIVAASGGCAGVDTTNATTLNLFREGGPPPDKEALARLNQRKDLEDMLFRIEAGDVIDIYLEKHGDLFELDAAEPVRLTFTRGLYAYMNRKGLFLSPDGKKFTSLDKFMDGSVSVRLSMEESNRENRMTVTVSTNVAD